MVTLVYPRQKKNIADDIGMLLYSRIRPLTNIARLSSIFVQHLVFSPAILVTLRLWLFAGMLTFFLLYLFCIVGIAPFLIYLSNAMKISELIG